MNQEIKNILIKWLIVNSMVSQDQLQENEEIIDEIAHKLENINFEDPQDFQDYINDNITPTEKEVFKVLYDNLKTEDDNKIKEQDYINDNITQTEDDNKIKEQFQNLIQDYHFFPRNSIEKSLQGQMIFYFQQRYQYLKKFPIQSDITLLTNKFMEAKKNIMSDPQIQKIFKQLKTQPKGRYNTLCRLKKKIMMINVLHLKRLIVKSQVEKNKIKNKNVFVIIGNTGAGKSTTILKFLGYNLVQKKIITTNGEQIGTLGTVEKIKQEHDTFHTSPQGKSCTATLNVVKLPIQMFAKGMQREKTDLYIVDTPGFGDLGGTEIDISNGISIIKSLKGCQTIKLAVILSAHEIYSFRMSGVVRMAQVISNLFTQIKSVLPSMMIFFNKFEKQENKNKLAGLIANRLGLLSPSQAADNKLIAILQHILEQSKNRDRFLDPIKGNFKKLLDTVVEDINPLMQKTSESIFRYNFTEQTQRQIQQYTLLQLTQVKNSFNQKKFQEARFHLAMIYVLHDIISGNTFLESKYKEATDYINEEIKKELNNMEHSLKDITAGYDSVRTYEAAINSKEILLAIHQYFPNFNKQIKQNIQELIQRSQNSLMKQLEGLTQKSIKVMATIYKFSQNFDKQFETKALEFLNQINKKHFDQFNDRFQAEKYLECHQSIQKLKVADRCLEQKPQEYEKSLKFYPRIPQLFQKKVSDITNFLQNFIQTTETHFYENQIILVNTKYIKALSEIDSLHILNQSQQINKKINDFKNKVEQKIKLYLKQQEQFVSRGEIQQLSEIRIDQKMKKKSKQIINLSKIDGISERTSRIIEITKLNISDKLKQKLSFVKKLTKNLRQKTDKREIEDSIEKICDFRLFILRCLVIVSVSQKQSQPQVVIQDFDKALKRYLQEETSNIDQLEHEIETFSCQNTRILNKISERCNKIVSFKKMQVIQGVKNEIAQMKKQFDRILKIPFDKFFQRELKKNQRESFKFQGYRFEGLQRICSYALKLKLVLRSCKYRQEFYSGMDSKLEQFLTPRFKQLDGFLHTFMEIEMCKIEKWNQLLNNQSKFRYLFSSLKGFVGNKYICEYVYLKSQIQVKVQIEEVQKKLYNLYDQINTQYERLICEDPNELVFKVKNIHSISKMLSSMEDIIKNTNQESKLKQLEKKIEVFMNSNIKDEYQKVQMMFKTKKISQIKFLDLKNSLDNLKNLKNANQANKIRGFVISSLQSMLQGKNIYFDRIQEEIQINRELFKGTQKLTQTVQQYFQGNILEKECRFLFIQDYQKVDKLKKLLEKFRENLLEIFYELYQDIELSIESFIFDKISEKIIFFGKLEIQIQKINDQQEGKQIDNKQQVHKSKLQSFVQDKKSVLSSKMKNQKNQKFENKNLRSHLEIMYQQRLSEMQKKYKGDNNDFCIDQSFLGFYQFEEKNNRSSILDRKIENHFCQYFQRITRQNSDKQRVDLYNKIDDQLKYLPLKLEIAYKNQFLQRKSNLRDYQTNKIKQYCQNLKISSVKLNDLFNQIEKSHKNGQISYFVKLVEAFQTVCKEKQLQLESLKERVNFVLQYFIKIVEKNNMIKENKLLFDKIHSRYVEQIQRLLVILRNKVIVLENAFERSSKEQKYSLLLDEIFSVFLLIKELNQNSFEENIRYKGQIIGVVSSRLNKILEQFDNKYNQRSYVFNLVSGELLVEQRKKMFFQYIKHMVVVNKMFEELKSKIKELSKTFQLNNPLNAQLKKEIYEIPDRFPKISEKLNVYQNQLARMLTQVDQYAFYNDIKRSWSQRQIQQNIKYIDVILSVLGNTSEYFNKYIIQRQQNRYDIAELKERMKLKCETLISLTRNEIQELFKDIAFQSQYELNVILSIIKLLGSKRYYFIEKNVIEEKNHQLNVMINEKFQQVKNENQKCLKYVKERKISTDKEMKQYERIRGEQVEKIKQIYNEKLKIALAEQTAKIDKKISNETDQTIKNQLEKSKNTQLNSVLCANNEQKQKEIKTVITFYVQKINALRRSLSEQIEKFSDLLILYKKSLLEINHDSKYNQAFSKLLQQVAKTGPKFIEILTQSLNKNQNDKLNFGKILLTTEGTFSNFTNKIRKEETKACNIEYVVRQLQQIHRSCKTKLKAQDQKVIEKMYLKQYEQTYKNITELYTKQPYESTINLIVRKCKDIGQSLKNQSYFPRKNLVKIGNFKVKLLSHIFGLWAILKSEKSEDNIQVSFPIEPHPAQIASLILLLNLTGKDELLQNRLAQVGTGQGKSIILAGLSSYLALTGFKVRCACYSSYLSQRDAQSFEQLFKILNIENSIRYGTFNQLCEDILNSEGNNFKEEVYNMIMKEPKGFFQKFVGVFGKNITTINRNPNQIQKNPTIMIIDQVDVFFDDNFFGNTYSPGITLRDPTIRNILQYVWNEVQQNKESTSISKIKQSKQYKDLIARYQNLKELLENQLHGMVASALNYQHFYFIIDQMIVYKDNDTISPNLNYGYKTVFVNILEYRKGNISLTNYQNAMKISLIVAEFSYALLPTYFRNILGVTGTLDVLPAFKKRQLQQRYDIKSQFTIPSAFGMQKRRIQNYFIVSEENHYKSIIDKIQGISDKRPIIIFFKNAIQLNDFFNSQGYQKYRYRTYNLTQEHKAQIRDARVSKATLPGRITLITSSFGRGTDFILYDPKVKELGGLHVIQTFLSLEESEELQIKGRTARQKNPGSYDCIINQRRLEELDLNQSDIPVNSSSEAIHDIFQQARDRLNEKNAQTTLNKLQMSDKSHQEVIKMYSKSDLKQKQLIDYIFSLNGYPLIQKEIIKTVLGLDATGSMSSALEKTCLIIGESFIRASEILKEKKIDVMVQIKIMVYRNYNSPIQLLLQETAFESTPENLRTFLKKVRAQYGCGNEAIQVFMQAVNNQPYKIDQVILIGDAAANTQVQVNQRRRIKPEQYWNIRFPKTNMNIQMAKFLPKNIPIHSFYLGADNFFRELSKSTKGEAQRFNQRSQTAVDELTAFIVVNILKIIQKRQLNPSGINLVQAYQDKYKDKKIYAS